MSEDLKETEVAAYVIKILPFWPSDPMLWFALVEAQFWQRGITLQAMKFDQVLANLLQQIATEARDLLVDPPADIPYGVSKETVIKRTALSEQRWLQQLALTILEIGTLLNLRRKMQQLPGEKVGAVDPSLLRQLFLQCLLGKVRMILASTTKGSSTLQELAEMADSVIEVICHSSLWWLCHRLLGLENLKPKWHA